MRSSNPNLPRLWDSRQGLTAVLRDSHSLVRSSWTSPNKLTIFLALREYAISPALVLSLDTPQYARRRAELGITNKLEDLKYAHHHQDQLALIRQDRLLDTGVAGAITGGGLNSWRGKHPIPV